MDTRNVGEIVRLFVLTLLGSLLLFVFQPLAYTMGVLRLSGIEKLDLWISDNYNSAATIIFITSVLATVAWYMWNSYSPPADSTVSAARSVAWWILLLLPILGMLAAMLLAIQPASTIGKLSGVDLPILAVMFIFDILILYWATTASSTPGAARRLPPGSALFRR